jgi:hypothetical protein
VVTPSIKDVVTTREEQNDGGLTLAQRWSRAVAVPPHFAVKPSIKDMVTTREEQDDGGLTLAQRWSRAVDFYKDAVPVLAAYLALGKQLQFEQEVLHRTVSVVEKDRRYDALHDWGSVRITDAIMRLKGFYVKTGQVT